MRCVSKRGSGLMWLRGRMPLFFRQHRRQKSKFRFHFFGIGHGFGDFLAKEFAIAFAQPVNGYLERAF